MPKNTKDIEKIKSLIARNVVDIVSQDIKNEHIGFMTITKVEVSSDHSYCKIFVSFLNNAQHSLETLNRAKGFVRSSLAKRVHFRRVPEISFVLDDSYFKQERFEELLAKDKKEITSIEELEKKLK